MTTKPQTLLPLPDPPEREPDDMTSVQHLGENGNLHHLIQHLGNPDNTIVSGERYIVPTPGTPSNQRIAPDLLIAFNANPASTDKTTATSSPGRANRPTWSWK